jgi:thiosulfate/3-mercaptopyruvate sulfurtransferase
VPATFQATLNPDAVKNLSQLKDKLANHQQILDARSAARFNGTAPEPRPGLSSGHMPGATSVPFTELVEDGRLKPAEKIRALFLAKDIDLQQPITTTCGSGVTAAVIALGLEIVGAQNVSLYDGSWTEYAQQPESVIEKNG